MQNVDHPELVQQQSVMKLLEDDTFPGLYKLSTDSASINRLNSNFAVTNMMLKLRMGVFSSVLGEAVAALEAHSLGNIVSSVTCLLLSSLAVGVAVIKHKHKSSIAIVGTIISIVIIILVITKINNNKLGIKALVTTTIPLLVVAANQAGSLVAAQMASQQNYESQNMFISDNLKDINNIKTLAEVYQENGYIPDTTQLSSAILKDQSLRNKVSMFTSKITYSDYSVGQMFCLSYISKWGKMYSCTEYPDRPNYFDSFEMANTVVFDFINQTRTSDNKMWSCTRAILDLNKGFPSCTAFVHAGQNPSDSKLLCIKIGDTYYSPATCSSNCWMHCKAILFIQAFMIIEVFHMAIHKVSAQQAIAQQYTIPISSNTYRVLEPFSIEAALALWELEMLLVGKNTNPLLTFSFFICDMEQLKRVLSYTVDAVCSEFTPSPCASKFEWWGSYDNKRRKIFKQTQTSLLTKSYLSDVYVKAWADNWGMLCGRKTNMTVDDAIETLYSISVEHSEATFLGGRMGLSMLQGLATGMLQRGITTDSATWDCDWAKHLPKLGVNDFTVWQIASWTTAYATSQSSGPYLFGEYTDDFPDALRSIAKFGFDAIVELGNTTKKNLKDCDFSSNWLEAPHDASVAYTTQTSGTYI